MQHRVAGLQARLAAHDFAAAILMHPRDVFYYAGTGQPCNLIIPAQGEPVLLARRALDWVKADASIGQIVQGGSGKDIREALKSVGALDKKRTLGLCLDIVPAALCRKLEQTLPEFKIEDVTPLILEQRMCKDEGELLAIRGAANLFQKAHEVMLRELKPGVTELALSGSIFSALRKEEHEGLPRFRRWDASVHPDGLVSSGPNTWRISGHAMTVTGVGLSPALPWGPSARPVAPGETVVIDIGINLHGYYADISRTYIVGKASEEQKRVFGVVKEAYHAVAQKIKPGVSGDALFKAAWEVFKFHKLEQYFQGYGDMQGHYIGHGIGLEMDEPPVLAKGSAAILQENMAVAIEPKVIIPEWGAIDLEDTMIVTALGCEILGQVPQELFEVI